MLCTEAHQKGPETKAPLQTCTSGESLGKESTLSCDCLAVRSQVDQTLYLIVDAAYTSLSLGTVGEDLFLPMAPTFQPGASRFQRGEPSFSLQPLFTGQERQLNQHLPRPTEKILDAIIELSNDIDDFLLEFRINIWLIATVDEGAAYFVRRNSSLRQNEYRSISSQGVDVLNNLEEDFPTDDEAVYVQVDTDTLSVQSSGSDADIWLTMAAGSALQDLLTRYQITYRTSPQRLSPPVSPFAQAGKTSIPNM